MRYLITFSYDGSKYYGYEKQVDKKTVQGEIEEKLSIINKKGVHISSSGRTDRGVHALNQIAHFDLDVNIAPDGLKKGLNSLLDGYIYIKQVNIVDSKFHARFDVLSKEYIYIINMGEYNPIEKDYKYQYCNKLNITNMKKASKYLIGTNDYKSFTKADDIKDSYVRTISRIKYKLNKNILSISFIGSGFMRYQIRNMVGSLIEVGENKFYPQHIKEVLDSKNRRCAGMTAPACGLYLKDIVYKK